MLSYRVSPYLHVGNPDDVGSSVIKLHVLDKKGKKETDIKDKDDPVEVYVSTNKLNTDAYFEDMTESLADSGVYMSSVDTNLTAGGFMIEIKITSLKICDIYGKYDGYPTVDEHDIYVITKGKSRIKDRHPLDLRVTFHSSIVKITLSPDTEGEGTLRPFIVTVSCEDDRADAQVRRKRASGLSLVKHQVRTGFLSVKTLENGAKNWTSSKDLKDLGADNGKIQFKSHFFGTFSANMFFIGPSPIDFSKLFANFLTSLEDNPYALIAIVLIINLFALLTVPLYRLDKHDEMMWRYIPLVDNPNSAHVVYYIAVETSVTSSKVMQSSVYINIIGKSGESGTRKLDDGTRQNFRRGTSSHFEMRVDNDLGNLQTIQVWHDNINGKTAWNLRKITVVKAETEDRYTFLCGKWLSLDSEDGRTWRSIDVLDEETLETETLFYTLSQRKLFDDHLWVSLFKRPRFSRFTRVQRLWCLVALLFLAMIASAMWYDTPDDNKMVTISVGPIKLNYKQFYVGFMSAMIALVPSMILVLIFRNRKFRGEQANCCYVPWWTIFFAYVLIFVCVGASATFVFLYSLQWGATKSLEWMVSFVISIFQSVIILEPIKAILLAILVACLFKKMASKEFSDKTMPVPHIATSTEADLDKLEASTTPSISYPDFPGTETETAELVVARQRAQIDKRMWSKFQSWLGILLYVILVAVICSHSDVSTAYQQNEHILQTLTTVQVPNSTNEIYDYLRTTFTRAVYPIWWESEDDELVRPAYVQRFTLNAYNYRITMSRLRQVRVQGNCSGPEITTEAVETCVPSFNKKTEEKRNFCVFWEDYNETDCFNENEEVHYAFLLNFGENKNGGDLTYTGEYGKYGPDGYYIDLGPKQSLVVDYLNLLQTLEWLDYRTRAVFLDVVTYNANTRLFSHIKLIFELPAVGGITMTKQVWSANLYPYVYALDYVILLLQIIFIIVWLVRFVLFLVKICRMRTRALKTISTYMRLLELMFGAAAIICCILRIDATISAISALKKSIGRYVSFELVRVYDAAYQGCLAAVLFIITLELLKPLEFNYHFFMLVSSLKLARTAIVGFMVIIAFQVVAFASLLYLTIGRRHEQFKSMPESLNTLLTVILGMMTYENVEDILLKLYFGLFTLSMTVTLVNVFIVLLTISFNDVKVGLKNGTLMYDERLNAHFWFKVNKLLQWFRDRFCFTLSIRNMNEYEKIQNKLEKLKRITKKITTTDLEGHKLTAKLIIKMIQIDKAVTKLDCLDVQWNEFATKYIFGYLSTGETLVILTVPALSCAVEMDITCYLVPCLRRDLKKKIHSVDVGKTFMFCTNDGQLIKGSVLLEILDTSGDYNTVVIRMKADSLWEIQDGIKTNSGVQASLLGIPIHFASLREEAKQSNCKWRPYEKYEIPPEGGTVYPSYDPGARVSFNDSAFNDPCEITIRTMPGEATSVLNVVLNIPPQSTMIIQLQKISTDHSKSKEKLAEYEIVFRENKDEEWQRLNSVLKKEDDKFEFTLSNAKSWSNLELTVKNSKILWIQDFNAKTYHDVDLIKAIIMICKMRDVAKNWRQMAALLNIPAEDIEQTNDQILCKEEKCFMVCKKWLERSDASFKTLNHVLTTMGHRVITEQIRQKWIVNSPKHQLKRTQSINKNVE